MHKHQLRGVNALWLQPGTLLLISIPSVQSHITLKLICRAWNHVLGLEWYVLFIHRRMQRAEVIAQLWLTFLTIIFMGSICTNYTSVACDSRMTLCFAMCLRAWHFAAWTSICANDIGTWHASHLITERDIPRGQSVTGELCVLDVTPQNDYMRFCVTGIQKCVYTCWCLWPRMCVIGCLGMSSQANVASLSPHYVSFTKQTSLHLWCQSRLWLWINKPQQKQ